MKMRKWGAVLVASLILVLFSKFGFANVTNEEVLKRLNDLSEVIQKQQEEIRNLKQQLEQQKSAIQEAGENQKEQIKAVVKAETKEVEKSWRDKLPEWTNRIHLAGDFRLRFEDIWGRDQLQKDGSTKSLEYRERVRFRFRFYIDGKVSEEIMTHFMLVTNQDIYQQAPTSNQTMGFDFNDKPFWIGRAYATYKPKWLEGLEVGAGKFRMNFYHTDIMWDPDVNPEGAYQSYRYVGSDVFQPFIYLSQLMVNENNLDTDASLFLNQAGFWWKLGSVRWMVAGSYYSWNNMRNSRWLNSATYKGTGGNTFIQDSAGNIGYAYDYKLAEAISQVFFKVGPFPVELTLNYINNMANGVPGGEDYAYLGSFLIGQHKKKGDYSLYYKYARIGSNAVVGALNDQDFYGANRKGHKVAIQYLPINNLILRGAFFYTDPVTMWNPNSPTFGSPYNDRDRMHENRVQFDCIFKF